MNSTTASKPQEFSADVRGQYEDFPYPFVDVEKEGESFNASQPNSLMALSHAGWGGKRDLRKDVRVLIAGCGTGSSTIMFAEELLGTNAEIVAIDISSKSIEIAQARMAKRGLTNVTFQHMSILDLPAAGLGQFDVIESSGVLHHLPDPNAGLAALTQMLKDDGIMSIMVYGQYGRMSVYLVQALMKELMGEDTPRERKVAIAREFLNNVPAGHWLTVNNELFLADMSWPDGSGIYDLFLHSTDRAYTVPQLYAWVEGAGLTLHGLFGDMVDESLYTPENYNRGALLAEIFQNKSARERHTIAELLHGNMAKHSFYATKQPKAFAAFADDMVMDYGMMQGLFVHFVDEFLPLIERSPVGQRIEGRTIAMPSQPPLVMIKTQHTAPLMKAIDGKRSIGDIVAKVARETNSAAEDVRRNLKQLYDEYRSRHVVFLRHESIPAYKTGREIIARVEKIIGKKK